MITVKAKDIKSVIKLFKAMNVNRSKEFKDDYYSNILKFDYSYGSLRIYGVTCGGMRKLLKYIPAECDNEVSDGECAITFFVKLSDLSDAMSGISNKEDIDFDVGEDLVKEIREGVIKLKVGNSNSYNCYLQKDGQY